MWTINQSVTTELKILRSRFITCLYPSAGVEEARKHLSDHTKQYADASHNCYAYICGLKGETSYYSDAGEPGGTAGKPILNALLRAEMTNVLAVVTRYYGGIKLGVKGLIEAYGKAVETAIQTAELVIARQLVHYSVKCDYPCYEHLKHKIAEFNAILGEIQFGQSVSFVLSIPDESKLALQEILDGYRTQSRLDYLQTNKGVN